MSTTLHILLISWFYNASDQHSSISYLCPTISSLLLSPSLECLPSHIFFWSLHSMMSSLTTFDLYLCMSIPSQLFFSYLLCNVYFPTYFSNLFMSYCDVSDQLFIPSQPFFFPLSGQSTMSALTGCSPTILITYHLSLSSFTISAMSTTQIFWSLYSMMLPLSLTLCALVYSPQP